MRQSFYLMHNIVTNLYKILEFVAHINDNCSNNTSF